MDYNSEQFSFDFSPQPPLPALSTHTSPASTNTQPSPPIRNRRRQHVIVIDAIRLSNQGDISNAYSGDLIDNGKIRRPFSYNGKLYVTTSSAHGHSLCKAEAYQLLLSIFSIASPLPTQTKYIATVAKPPATIPMAFTTGSLSNIRAKLPY
jgi:hypothetical protein